MESMAHLCKITVKRVLTGGLLAGALLHASTAHANLRPGSLYDARSAGLGGTGIAYIENGAASFHNPANMSTIIRSATTLTLSPFLNDVTSPVPQVNPATGAGSLQQKTSGYALAPLGQLGTAWRIHERLVLGVNAFVAAGAAVSWSDTPVPNQTASISAIQAELQIPLAIKILDNLSVGIAYRMTYGILDDQLYTQLNPQQPPALVKISSSDVNFKGLQAGLHYTPIPELDIGFSYRNEVSLNFSGTANVGGTDLTAAEGNDQVVTALAPGYQAPHEFGGGVALHLLDRQLLVAVDYRHYLYSQVTAPLDKGWKDAWNAAIGAEYLVTPMVPVRLGFSYGEQGTSDATASFFSIPPGHPASVSIGSGLNLGEWTADLSVAYAWYEHQVPADAAIGQAPGDYKLSTVEIFLAGTYAF